MKTLKILLILLIVLALGILIGIALVWKELAFDAERQVVIPSDTPILPESGEVSPEAEVSARNGSTNTPSAPVLNEPFTVTKEMLTPAQQAVLTTLGMEETSFTITPRMVTCAVEALGAERVSALRDGDSPTLSEGLTLITCSKR